LVTMLMTIGWFHLMDSMRLQGIEKRAIYNSSNQFAVIETIVLGIIWFWGRARFKQWLWVQIKPGGPSEFLRDNRRSQAGVKLAMFFVTMLLMLGMTKFL